MADFRLHGPIPSCVGPDIVGCLKFDSTDQATVDALVQKLASCSRHEVSASEALEAKCPDRATPLDK
jgi:hypothetical protein